MMKTFWIALSLALASQTFLASDAKAWGGSSYSTCMAETRCGYFAATPFGPQFIQTHAISCVAYASNYGPTACTWAWEFNHYVRCQGFDAWGRWVDAFFRC